MSNRNARAIEIFAPVFAALGDATRLQLVAKLSSGEARSIADLTEGSALTRQAITKHLRVLEGAGIVHSERTGRESLYALDPKPLAAAGQCLDAVAEQWGSLLQRLKTLVED